MRVANHPDRRGDRGRLVPGRELGDADAVAGRGPGSAAGPGRGAAAQADQPHLHDRDADRDRAHRHPGRAGGDRAAQPDRQARQPGHLVALQRRYRLDHGPRPAHRGGPARGPGGLHAAQRHPARHRPDLHPGRQSGRRARQHHQPKSRPEPAEPDRQDARSARRRARQCHAHVAARARRQLAHGAQSHRPGGGRGFRLVDRRHQDRRVERGQAAPGQAGQRAGGGPAGAPARRSVPGGRGPPPMGEAVPLGLAGRRRRRPARPLARDPTDPGLCGPAAHRCERPQPGDRGAGRDPGGPGPDHAGLPVPGCPRAGAAVRRGPPQHRGADRRAVHRGQPAVGRCSSPARPSRRTAAAPTRPPSAPPASPPPGTGCCCRCASRAARRRAGSAWGRRPTSMSGAARCSIRSTRPCG